MPYDSHSGPHTGDRAVDTFAENLGRRVRREPLLHVLDPGRRYQTFFRSA
jgi:hypothetical protein